MNDKRLTFAYAPPSTLRKAIALNPGLAYMVDQVEVISPLGRKSLLDTTWSMDAASLEKEYDATAAMAATEVRDGESVDAICRQLMCLRDISGTVAALRGGQILGDIELYEIKSVALVATEIRAEIRKAGIEGVEVPDLTRILELLDPEGSRVAHFYIYDAYSPELKAARQRLKAASEEQDEIKGELFAICSDLERSIREKLSEQLHSYSDALSDALNSLGRLDLLIARSRHTSKLGLHRPHLGTSIVSYKGLWHPQISEILSRNRRRFQPVDIEIRKGVTVITGSNMAGKSVVLKMVALSQQLAQFGFYVPATEAEITPVAEVLTSIGDAQSELEGLSSYAAEMLRINRILTTIREGNRCLALIDEPARTTNPEEGKALVNAVIELLGKQESYILLTTHYSGLTAECRRLRVHGFREEKAKGISLSAANVNDYIDYSLEECAETSAPHEALRIARLIGVDPIIADTAARYIDKALTSQI